MRKYSLGTELCSAAALATAVFVVQPGELSGLYALVVILCSVAPGLMLTGDIKLINAGMRSSSSNLTRKAAVSTILNLCISAAAVVDLGSSVDVRLLVLLVLLGSVGGTAQTFSSVWYYCQRDEGAFLRSKTVSAGVKILLCCLGIAQSELLYSLVGIAGGAIIEFAFNFRSLPPQKIAQSDSRVGSISLLGVAYGLSRIVLACTRIGLSQLLGSQIARFVIVEQLVGGANTIYEKYFVRSMMKGNIDRILKGAYLVASIPLVLFFLENTPPSQAAAWLPWLIFFAIAGLLPLSEMYITLRSRGERFVSRASIAVSLISAGALFLSFLQGDFARGSLIIYLLLPAATFLLYWLGALGVHNNPQ